MYDAVNLTRRDGAAWIELNRPDALNAWNTQLGEDLNKAVLEVAADDEVRAVVITGSGRAFSSGADLKAGFEPTPAGHPDVHTRLTQVYHPIITTIRRMPKPVIAGVNGPAVGIGCSLALACDLVLAAESAYLLLAFVNIGLVPDGGSSLFVPARAGFTRAAEMALLGEKVPARQAYDWNLVNKVVADESFRDELEGLATRFASGPTGSFAGTKRQLNRWLFQGMDDQLALEADIQQERAASADFMEGVMAFVEKRDPRFTGR
ncbi:MAG TPA: enoyl-CoA hydratase-related protein [Solirubrobacteraceae bacterium]|nr:enoyl-CoA hydratase-related protein [Solirubrobacteraceae bacterium]